MTWSELKEIFSEDYIRFGSFYIRPLSIMWFIVRITETLLLLVNSALIYYGLCYIINFGFAMP